METFAPGSCFSDFSQKMTLVISYISPFKRDLSNINKDSFKDTFLFKVKMSYSNGFYSSIFSLDLNSCLICRGFFILG